MSGISVLHVCTDFSPSTGGIERFVASLARDSKRRGLNASVLCLNRVGSSVARLPREDTIDGISVQRVPFFNLRLYKPVVLPISVLRAVDIIHVHGLGAPLDFVAATKLIHGRPIVLSTHGGIFHTRNFLRLKKLYFSTVVKLSLSRVEKVVACGESDAELFSKIREDVVIIDNAIETGRLLELSLAGKREGRCLCVARLAENKSHEDLLRAFSRVAEMGVQFDLRCVGPDVDGRSRTLLQLARDLGVSKYVKFVGELSESELLDELAEARLFLSASRYEGFGLAAIEAKAAGCRLVLQDNAAYRAAFAHDEVATLVDFRNAASAAVAIVGALSCKEDASLQHSRAEVCRYSWDQVGVMWQELYKSIVRDV